MQGFDFARLGVCTSCPPYSALLVNKVYIADVPVHQADIFADVAIDGIKACVYMFKRTTHSIF